MSLLSRLFTGRRAAPRADVSSSDIRRGDGIWEALGASAGSQSPPSESAALAVSAIYACVTLISGAIAALPMDIYRRSRDADLERDHDNALWWVLNEEFSPRWTAYSGWSFMAGSRLLHGDAYAKILRRGDGTISGLVPVHPNRVTAVATPDGARLIYKVVPDPTIVARGDGVAAEVLDQDDMLHVPGFGFNGLRSLSPLRVALRDAGQVAIGAQQFSRNFLGNAARPDMAIRAKGNLDDEQYLRLQEMVNAHMGPQNAGRPLLLEDDLQIERLTMPMEDMQLIETRRFQVEEIARIYGVPPFMIGHTDKTTSWGSGVEQMGIGFVRFTLRDHLSAFSNELNRKLFRAPSNRVAMFDTTDIERADTKSMFEAMRIAIGRAGEEQIMTTDEVRAYLRLPRRKPGTVPPQERGTQA